MVHLLSSRFSGRKTALRKTSFVDPRRGLTTFLVVPSPAGAEPQILRFFLVLQIGQQPLIGEVERAGILPILMDDVVKAVNHFIIVDFNRQFTPAVEAARRKID